MVRVEGEAIRVETSTLSATLRRGLVTELVRRSDGKRLIQCDGEGSALQLIYPHEPDLDVLLGPAPRVSVHPLSNHAAQFRLGGWDGDGVITVSEDLDNGDLLIEPAANSSRRGVLACRWRMPGIAADLELVAPFFQGVKLPLNDPLLQRRWSWPMHWEAGLAIYQGADGGLSVHCRDTQYRYKAISIMDGQTAFDTEAYGPVCDSRGAGGLVWRLNVHTGDWHGPASAYRDWLWEAYRLNRETRCDWLHKVRFAVSWYHGDPEILDALAERLDPATVLLHYSQWRTDAYDENYPTYQPSADAIALCAKAQQMGFHLAPHANSVDMDPSHPSYDFLQDYEYRDVATRRRHGWAWSPEWRGGPPNSNVELVRNRHRKVMIKAHPGLSMWRSILSEEIGKALDQVSTDTVFIDVTLCSGNLDNCLVENTTSSEGMNRLIHEIAALRGGLAVGGEGLNEITFQGLSFAQAHLFNSHHATHEDLGRCGGCDLNEFLFGRLCRTMGYSRLSGATEEEALRMRIHDEHGAIPTVTIRSAEEIRNPNPVVARYLKEAAG